MPSVAPPMPLPRRLGDLTLGAAANEAAFQLAARAMVQEQPLAAARLLPYLSHFH